MTVLRAGLLQMCSSDDPAANLPETVRLIDAAADAGARFVLTPEVTNCVSASRTRQQQVLHLCRELGDLPGMPTVWAGDFNDWSRAPVMERWAPRMRFLPPRPSFPSACPVGALDRIALSDELTVAGHGVHSARPAHIASDHLPVWADLRAQESGRVRPAG